MKYLDLYFSFIILFLFMLLSYIFINKNIWFSKRNIISFELNGKSTNKTLIDIYTISHFTSGLILSLITNNNLYIANLISILFEIFENLTYFIKKYRKNKKYNNYVGDSVVNSITDHIFLLLGFYFNKKFLFNKKNIILLIFILELITHPFNANLFNTLFLQNISI